MIRNRLRKWLFELLEPELKVKEPWMARVEEERAETDAAYDAYHKDKVVPGIDEDEYTIYETNRDGLVSLTAFLQFPEVTDGDRFVVRVYVALSGEDFALYDRFTLGEDLLETPVASLSNYTAPHIKVTVEQTRGLSRPIVFELFAKYLPTTDQLGVD